MEDTVVVVVPAWAFAEQHQWADYRCRHSHLCMNIVRARGVCVVAPDCDMTENADTQDVRLKAYCKYK